MLVLFIDVLSGCRGYKFMGLQLSRVIGVIDDGLSGLYPDYWGYPYVRVLPVTGLKV